ncbi:dienelactone hydrolase [Arthrobacter sp. PvP102]|jgi:carboxymethylenebutenolidase|uniref:hypothetical protein n=1 Tax=unclassified Arthrobacter TaxID=235627 RepID=UPI001AE26630|nr:MULTISPECIES: hypothetical protein [unclassified Arthrobacter]MBP1231640.1 dienelactone hydrolase [Arthrobacter sp. PvP103]MBP1236775.1 dienelactone hydrolase [Arthrobacter sp. PvP102]
MTVQLGKFERYLIEEFFDDYRAGAMPPATPTGTGTPSGSAAARALTRAGVQRHVADFATAFDFLASQDFVDAGRMAMTGFCVGGGIGKYV